MRDAALCRAYSLVLICGLGLGLVPHFYMFRAVDWVYLGVLLAPSLTLLLCLPDANTKTIVLKSLGLSLVLGYALTDYLVPIISEFTLKKGLSGRDLGKKGTPKEDALVPEALGLVPATCFLICAIGSQVGFIVTHCSCSCSCHHVALMKLLSCRSCLSVPACASFCVLTNTTLSLPTHNIHVTHSYIHSCSLPQTHRTGCCTPARYSVCASWCFWASATTLLTLPGGNKYLFNNFQ